MVDAQSLEFDTRVPELTVVVVRDHLHPAIEDSPCSDFTACLEGLLEQDFEAPFKVLVAVGPEEFCVVSRRLGEQFGRHLDFEVLRGPSSASHELRNFAYSQSRSPMTMHLDADCVTRPGCLTALVSAMRSRCDADIVSCVTTYGDNTSRRRVAGILERGPEAEAVFSLTRHICANAALFRTDVLLRHPIEDGPPFTKGLARKMKLLNEGVGLYVEPKAVVYHEYEGPSFSRDFWRTKGFASMASYSKPSSFLVPWLMLKNSRSCLVSILRLGNQRLKGMDWILVAPAFLNSRRHLYLGMRDCIRGEKNALGTSFI